MNKDESKMNTAPSPAPRVSKRPPGPVSPEAVKLAEAYRESKAALRAAYPDKTWAELVVMLEAKMSKT